MSATVTATARLRAVLDCGGPASSGGLGRESDCAGASDSSVFTPLRSEGMQRLQLQPRSGAFSNPLPKDTYYPLKVPSLSRISGIQNARFVTGTSLS